MARYHPEHKEATRRRMIEAAGQRFKSDGIDGSGIATLVADAGLTNGAFYGHFSSKEDLVATVVAQQLEDQVAVVNSLPAGLESVEAFLREYLSAAHREDLAGGCPSAALLDEIGRCDVVVREAYTEGVSSMIKAIARHLDDGDSQRTNERAIGLFSLLVGSLQAARAVTDTELSDRILAAAFSNAMTLAGASRKPERPTTRQETE
ncbi:TetR/AcrR family transcriptional regulator [Mycobacterium sp. CBMA271]|uniref:TetR/AcrR family transcriptional regulator n=1 Tax=unclassified Mycobacteroides TaxID=2618759 RepID=UPI0012DD4DE1|nr:MULTISPECIES: TetR/AcrR family transcriptional regulator [unclassified Mycobacteroides]MUM18840.1 TetR family transcriptional regulator [Mycobacteroides sp. CBMA 326]MUM23220.1 TetR/AcrR family transcriptional regulator [Mycobacteroides sp. CBMA 271]